MGSYTTEINYPKNNIPISDIRNQTFPVSQKYSTLINYLNTYQAPPLLRHNRSYNTMLDMNIL